MPLPEMLLIGISQACSEQALDASDVIRAIEELVADDTCKDYSVWSGPGFGQDTLQLDVYVLGTECLYNYSVLKEVSAGSCVFLDSLSQISLARVEDGRSPYVLFMRMGEEFGRMFGGEADRARLERFHRNIIAASLSARRLRR